MAIEDINTLGWVFLASLGIIIIGLMGWYLNRSMIELAARIDKNPERVKYSYLQGLLLPKYRSSGGRMANEAFHTQVDQKSKNATSRTFLALAIAGLIGQIGLWIYVTKFATGTVSFLN